MVYYKSLIVVALCTAFVLGFYVVLQYEAAVVGSRQTSTTDIVRTSSCPVSDVSCVSFSMSSPSLRTLNYSSELGPGGYTVLSFNLDPSGGSIQKLSIFLNGTLAGTLQGPFVSGETRVVNFTLPATVSVTSGKLYIVSAEGFYGNGAQATWQAIEVRAS